MKMMIACTTGKWARTMDWKARNPMPLSAKIELDNHRPTKRKPSETAMSDTTGKIALRNACLKMTDVEDNPFARAVRM